MAGAALLVVAGVSCTTGADYTMPHQICGEEYDSDLLADLLPGGSELEDREIPVVSGSFICYIEVDSSLVVSYEVSVDHETAIPSPSELGGKRHLDGFTDLRHIELGEEAVVADRGASAMTECPGKGEEMVLRLDVLLPGDHSERDDYTEQRENLEAFLRDFFPPVAEGERCGAVDGDGLGGMAAAGS